jgi:hypothetical protein
VGCLLFGDELFEARSDILDEVKEGINCAVKRVRIRDGLGRIGQSRSVRPRDRGRDDPRERVDPDGLRR